MTTEPSATDDLRSLLLRGETASLECKSAKGGFPKSFWESYSAFANTDGGTIVLGVSEPRKGTFAVDGVARPDILVKTLWDTVNNPDKVSANVLFDRHVRAKTLDGKTVVVVDVPRADRADRPVYVGRDVFRGTFRRNGEGDYRCPRESVLAMLRDQSREPSDGAVAEELTVADLNAESVRRYHTLLSNLKPDHVWTRLPDEELLVKIGAAVRGRDGMIRPTVAGLVCFGDFVSILRVLPDFFLDYRDRIGADERWSDRVCSSDGTWSGNVFDFFFRVHPRLTADLKVPFSMRDSVTRIDDTPAHKALREALANALIHADWRGRCGVVVEKTFRRIVISNPGAFRIPKPVAIAGGTSDARNANIFNIFSLVDIGERSGSGLCNLFAVWDQNGFPFPTIEENFDPDRVVLTISTEATGEKTVPTTTKTAVTTEKTTKKIAATTTNPTETAEKTREKIEEIREKTRENAGPTREEFGENAVQKNEFDGHAEGESHGDDKNTAARIVAFLGSNPSATQDNLAAIAGITVKGVEWHLKKLKAAGRLRRVGPARGGHWEVVETTV